MPDCEEGQCEAACEEKGELDGQSELVVDLEWKVRAGDPALVMVVVASAPPDGRSGEVPRRKGQASNTRHA